MAYDEEIATATVWMEASGEPPEGRRGVAWVLVNRLNSGRYGKSLADVCLSPFQFSCWNTSDPNRRRMARTPETDPVLLDCGAALQEAQAGGTDPTQGATLYYADSMTTPPEWAAKATFTVQLGSQLFFRENIAATV